jgi:hypothetical protein
MDIRKLGREVNTLWIGGKKSSDRYVGQPTAAAFLFGAGTVAGPTLRYAYTLII